MEFHGDFLEFLDQDVSTMILMGLDDPADIVRASSVSRLWRDFVITNGICKHLCLKLFPQLSGISRVMDTSNKNEKCADVGCSRSIEWEHLKMEHRAFVCLARVLVSSEVGECISDAISASSTDNYPEESVRHTLEPRDRIGRRASYWSSSGQSNPEVTEKLIYKLISNFCIITEINVQPFQAFFQADFPIYSAKYVRFRLGHRAYAEDSEEEDNVLEGPQCAAEKFVWTYTSQLFPMVQDNHLQIFKLPEPVICFGGFLQIELVGRVQRQEMDGLFYICVAHVKVLGRSLSPVFGIDPVDQNGTFTLLYNPDAKFPSPSTTNESDKISATPEMEQRQSRGGWEQILNMLRGTLGVEVYDSDDEVHDLDADDEMGEEYAL
ncbi:unnamed protein product [Amaranthus hypochondriacus]